MLQRYNLIFFGIQQGQSPRKIKLHRKKNRRREIPLKSSKAIKTILKKDIIQFYRCLAMTNFYWKICDTHRIGSSLSNTSFCCQIINSAFFWLFRTPPRSFVRLLWLVKYSTNTSSSINPSIAYPDINYSLTRLQTIFN
jgi:hypothetical protein